MAFDIHFHQVNGFWGGEDGVEGGEFDAPRLRAGVGAGDEVGHAAVGFPRRAGVEDGFARGGAEGHLFEADGGEVRAGVTEVGAEFGEDFGVGFEGDDTACGRGAVAHERAHLADVGTDVGGGFAGVEEAGDGFADGEVEDAVAVDAGTDGFAGMDLDSCAPREADGFDFAGWAKPAAQAMEGLRGAEEVFGAAEKDERVHWRYVLRDGCGFAPASL
jgi:hypothetical protein